MPSALTIQLLGEFRILYDGKSLAGISADRPQSLLAYLLLHRNAPQPRQHLAFLFWPDSSEAQARTNLRNLLFSLRQALPDADSFIASDTLTVQWRTDASFQLDVARFEEALQGAGKGIDAAARRALEDAVASYTGDLLPGNYDDWIAPLRAELRQRFLDALMRLIDLLEADGDYRAAISANQRLIAQDPINERAYVQLMRLYALSGDRAGVRHVYQQCVAALERELEVGPSPSTTKAYEQLLRLQPQTAVSASVTSAGPLVEESVVSATAQPTTVPRVVLQPKPLLPPSTPFLGRQTELAEIERHLRDPHCRLLTLVGLGGIGKTRLALHVAVQCRGRFPDGIAFVPLAGVQDSTLIWQAIADALNLPLTSSSLPMQTVLHGLRDVSMLIVLDNMEQLLADITPITELLAGAPSIKILATSRERLNLVEEWVFAVTGLASSDRESSPLEDSAATALFLQTARRTQSGFSPNVDDAAAIRHICKLVDGMPLGIELAAAWVNMLSPAEIAHEIERNLDFLSTPARNVPERHRTMRAVFDQSWKLLTPTEQRLFRQLSVFRGGFVRPMAQRVADANLASLASLVDKSLLRWAANGRYELHERVRQYAYHKLHEAGEAEATHDRHLAALGEIEQRLRHDIYSAEQPKALDELFAERDNIYAALEWSLQQTERNSFSPRVLRGIHLISSLAVHWHLLGNNSDGLRWVELALEHAQLPFPLHIEHGQWIEARARALAAAGEMMATLDNLPGAQGYLLESIAHWRGLNDKQRLLNTIHRLLEAVGGRGDAQWVDSLMTEALVLAKELDNPPQLARTLAIMADMAGERGQFEQAGQWADEALTIFRASNALGMEIYMLNIRAQLAIYGKRPEEAVTLLLEATSIWQERSLAKQRYHPWTTRNLGLAYQALGQYAQALESYQHSLQSCYEQARSAGVAWAIEGMAEVAALTNDPARAASLWALAARLRKEAKSSMSPPDQARYAPLFAQVRSQLTASEFEAAWRQGSGASVEGLLG